MPIVSPSGFADNRLFVLTPMRALPSQRATLFRVLLSELREYLAVQAVFLLLKRIDECAV